LDPVGYGFRSIEYIVKACLKARSLPGLTDRQRLIREYDEKSIMATPRNSNYNELVIEAGRKSILSGGREVAIDYTVSPPAVDFRKY